MTLLSSSLYLALGAGAAAIAGIWAAPQPTPATAPPLSAEATHAPHVPAKLVITHPRICAAVAVYDLADANDWGLWCLGTTKHGAPRHPLYVRSDQPLIPWEVSQ